MPSSRIEELVSQEFERLGVIPESQEIRRYPNEVNVIVFVQESDYSRAVELSETVETELEDEGEVLIIVRRAKPTSAQHFEVEPVSLDSPQTAALQQLIAARNRVSEVQPSLSYIKDLAGNISTLSAPRHHLVFGRRGAGKSTLLVETKTNVESAGALTAWVNLQTLRRDEPDRIFIRATRAMIGQVLSNVVEHAGRSNVVNDASALYDRLSVLAQKELLTADDAARLIPDVQEVLSRALTILDTDLFVFLDDFYYVPRDKQPLLLDMLHGCVRDCRAWLKVASIRHLTRWFVSTPPLGLQTGHDADVVDLDVTLEDPTRVRRFLVEILESYAGEAGVQPLRAVFRTQAIDRLVLASGGVPRDFLVLTAASIGKARAREAKNVGVQDVNEIAGEAANEKIQELEEDLATNEGLAGRTLEALQVMRDFCLEEASSTYYRVDFREKENHAVEYQIFTDLLDLRLVHLIHAGVSDAHEAGRRYEVFMLDLSQFSGRRFKQGLRVLELDGETLVAKRTRQASSKRRADTPLQLIAVMRAAPLFGLTRLSHLVEYTQS